MCGISGVFSLTEESINLNQLISMSKLIRHRGPDDEGFYLANDKKQLFLAGQDSLEEIKSLYPIANSSYKGYIGLGFRRLSILDLSASGHQPMQDSSTRYTIVFNGEIYNYLELREKLINKGYSFKSNTDTEVILSLYKEYQEKCFQMLNGMWAIAIWDNQLKELTLCRDRWGIKPLCYLKDGQTIYFASEEKQFKALDKILTPNYNMIYRYLKLGSMVRYGEETFYQEIKCLKAAHYMKVSKQGISIKRYYEMDFSKFETYQDSFTNACDEYQLKFQQAVALRMRSDVEVGSCLSGGLDSSAIVCTASKLTNNKLKTFSAYYDLSSAYDERKWMKIVNDHCQANSHYISPKVSDVLEDFTKITYQHDAPVIGSSPVSQYYVMKQAKQAGVTVVLDGQGSDEITAGYNHAFYRYYADMIKNREFGSLTREFPEYLTKQQKGSALAKVAKTMFTLFKKESSLYNYEIKHNVPDVFKSRYSKNIISAVQDIKSSKLSNFQYNLLNNIFLQSLLHFEDRNSMSFSLESRVPFLDVNLVEFAYSLPSNYKIRASKGKLVHRYGLKSIVPEAIYNRKDKVNFSAPGESVWLRKEMKNSLQEVINSRFFTSSGEFDTPKLGEIVHNYLRGDNRHGSLVWKLYALGVWYNLNFEGAYGRK